MRRAMFGLALVMMVLAPVLLVSCSSDEYGKVEGPMADYPEWITTENNTYNDDGTPVIFAVGAVSVGRNPAMMWDAARNNALVNISRILNTHVRAMFTSYAREAGDYYDEDTLSSIRNDEQVSRTLTESFISGAVTVNKYLTKDGKTAYVLMKLDLNNKTLQALADKAKAAVREHFAAKVKAQTEEALAKMDQAAAALKADLGTVPPAPAAVKKEEK